MIRRRRDELPAAPVASVDTKSMSNAIGVALRADAERLDLATQMISCQKDMISALETGQIARDEQIAALRAAVAIHEETIAKLADPARVVITPPALKTPVEPKAN